MESGDGVTKDELIEAMAHVIAEVKWPDIAWADLYPSEQVDFRRDAKEVVPLIVGFVADWLRTAAEERTCTSAAVEEWLADMEAS